jgi:hypothetical protein
MTPVGCCAEVAFAAAEQAGLARREELKAAEQPGRDGRPRLALSVPDIRCGQCIATIERAFTSCPKWLRRGST